MDYESNIVIQDAINNAIFNIIGGINFLKKKWMIRARYNYSMGKINSNKNHFYTTLSTAYRWVSIKLNHNGAY